MYWIARIAGLRGVLRGLEAADLDPDPLVQVRRWYASARRLRLPQPNAMALATVSADGQPSSRFVLLKEVETEAIVFYTNYHSRKSRELEANPRASAVMYWPGLERQVRLEGSVEKVAREQSEAYFGRRPRGSQLGAWASRQSEPAGGREELAEALAEADRTYQGGPVPCPPHWGGFRLRPHAVEIWQGRAARLHDRFVYRREGGHWQITRLFP